MKFFATLVSLAVSSVSAFSLSAAPIYLKADAPDGGDGSSWSTAYTDPVDALAALNASADARPTLLIAKGFYYSAKSAPKLVKDNFVIKGGYRAQEDGDLMRDVKEYQTVFSSAEKAYLTGDKTLKHMAPDATGIALVDVGDTMKFYDEETGKLVFPEDVGGYTGELDCFRQTSDWGWSFFPITVGSGAGGEISGISFCGAYSRAQFSVDNGSTGLLVEDCGFYCGYSRGVVSVNSANATTFRRCAFRFNDIISSGVLCAGDKAANLTVENCLFADNVPRVEWVMQLVTLSGANSVMRNCDFRRNLIYYSTSTDCREIGGLLRAKGGTLVEETFFTNNFISVFGTHNQSLVEANGAQFDRCVFANNLARANPCKGMVYALFQSTYAAGNNALDGCVFRGNVFEGVSEPTGDFAVAPVANGRDGTRVALVNCTFDSNVASSVSAEGAVATLCRGVLVQSTVAAGSVSELGLANCTFTGSGAEGMPDVVQYGAGHSKPLNVLNCIFMNDRIEPIEPFALASPVLVNIVDCTVKNMLQIYRPTDYDLSSGLQTDGVPLVPDGAWLRPSAKTPGLRTTADVAIASPNVPRTYQYRVRGSDAWTALMPAITTSVVADDPALLADAFGCPRPEGTSTRGAVQELKEPAETGVSLTVRIDPLTAGFVSTPSTQATTVNGAIVPVTATAEGTTFLGWYRENGDLYERNETLEIDSLGSDLVLSAKFAARQVTICFDLGGKGLFTENGQTTIERLAAAGSVFPEIPPYTLQDGFVLYDAKTPAVVPDVSETVVIRPEILSTGVRIVYLTPTGAGDRDGTSWANAYGSVAEAIADAGKIRGEVWAKTGRYVLGSSVAMKSNVTLRGGFAGTESKAEAADPAAHPTVFTGDVNGDDRWISVLDGATAVQTPVWEEATLAFNSPNPERAHDYWKAAGNISENTGIGFSAGEGTVSNVEFAGVVFSSFSQSAVYALGAMENLTVTNCVFAACGGSDGTDVLSSRYRALHGRAHGSFRVIDTQFVGNTRCAYLACSDDEGVPTNLVLRCRLVGNNADGLYLSSSTDSVTRVEALAVEENGVGTWVTLAPAAQGAHFELTDSVFRHNRQRNGGYAVMAAPVKSGVDYLHRIFVTRCRFEENELFTNGGGCLGVYAGGENSYDSILVSDCRFAGNAITKTGSGNSDPATVAFDQLSYSQLYVYNTAMESNVVSGVCAGIVGRSQRFGGMKYLNCSFVGNSFPGGGSDSAGEIVAGYWLNGGGISFVNSAVGDYPEDHRIFALRPANSLSLQNCVVEDFDPEQTGITSADNITAVNVGTVAPAFSRRVREGANGLCAHPPQYDSPVVRKGLPVSLSATTGQPYYYIAGRVKPWTALDGSTLSEADAAALGLSLSNLAPDMLGAPRRLNRLAYGPVNAWDSGLLLLIQ